MSAAASPKTPAGIEKVIRRNARHIVETKAALEQLYEERDQLFEHAQALEAPVRQVDLAEWAGISEHAVAKALRSRRRRT